MKTRRSPLKTLVLDLDETLVHSSLRPDFPYEHVLRLTLNGQQGCVFTSRRPDLAQFLREVSQVYEVVAFTASDEEYGNAVLDWIDPEKLIKYRLFKDACSESDGLPIKDLRVLGRDLSQVVVIDNSLYAFGLQLDNGIPIQSWYGDAKDEELARMIPVLRALATMPDVTHWLAKHLRLKTLVLGDYIY